MPTQVHIVMKQLGSVCVLLTLAAVNVMPANKDFSALMQWVDVLPATVLQLVP